MENKNEKSALEELVEILKALKDRNYMREHIFLAMLPMQQRMTENDPDCPTRDLCDLKVTIRVELDPALLSEEVGTASMQIKRRLLALLDYDEDECFAWAKANLQKFLYKTTALDAMEEGLKESAEVMNVSQEDLKEIIGNMRKDDYPDMTVLKYFNQPYGVAQILNFTELKRIASQSGVDRLIIIPSSIEEICIVPELDWVAKNKYGQTIKEVNAGLSPERVISDHYYIYDATLDAIVMDEPAETVTEDAVAKIIRGVFN